MPSLELHNNHHTEKAPPAKAEAPKKTVYTLPDMFDDNHSDGKMEETDSDHSHHTKSTRGNSTISREIEISKNHHPRSMMTIWKSLVVWMNL